MWFSKPDGVSDCAPVIIAGMHRSGTSILTKILDDLGLFVGNGLDSNHEPNFFVTLNNWLLHQAGGAWDYPEPFADFLKYDDLVASRVAQLDRLMAAPRAIQFMGLKRYLNTRSIKNMTQPWGWKDPRNTFTLPLWLKVFPNAKLLVIHRHGVDVANSLATRAEKMSKALPAQLDGQAPVLWRLPLSILSFSRCRDTEEGMKLWQLYSETADQYAQALGERALVLRYEEFLSDPVPQVEKALDFIGIEAPPEAVSRSVDRLVASRAYSYQGSDNLRDLAARYRTELSAFGYSG